MMQVNIKNIPIRVHFGESWLHNRYGINFGREFWSDPIRRTENRLAIERELFNQFAEVGIGNDDPSPVPWAADEYGQRFMPALFGCDIKYLPGQAPCALPFDADFDKMSNVIGILLSSDGMSKGLIATLTPPDIFIKTVITLHI